MSASQCWRIASMRASRPARYHLRQVRRSRMKANSNTSATITETIAFSTKAAGPSLRNVSKTETISKSKACFCPVLRSPLIRCEPRHVLTSCKLETEASAIRLRRKLTDLVDLREILGPDGEENISSKAASLPARDGKSKACHS